LIYNDLVYWCGFVFNNGKMDWRH